jgi:hypothetical protein
MNARLTLALSLALLAPLTAGCFVAAAAGAGYVVSTQVLPNNVHVAQVALDVEKVWPSVKETVGFFQSPGTELEIQEMPRSIQARVDGAKVQVEVEAYDIDQTMIRVVAEKYLAKDNATAAEVLQSILDRLNKT